MNVLDCSLRDGGFLNQWKFSAERTGQIIRAVAEANVDFIEVGYFDAHVQSDSMRLSREALERMREAAEGVPLAAMMRGTCPNAREVLEDRKGLVDLIRIPCAIQQASPALTLAELALSMGFRVSLNLTNVSASRLEDIEQVATRIPAVDVVYLADSRGAIRPVQVPELVRALRKHWSGPIGFHAHDNLGFAQANAQSAIEAGCTWVDGSVAGIGLGGRNLRIDEALRLAGRTPTKTLLEAREVDWVDATGAPPKALYVASAQANISQDWVGELVAAYGAEYVAQRIPRLPQLNWQTREQVELWFATWDRLKPAVRLRVYQAQGREHESAERVFFDLVKPVHERHGAVFLGREVHEDGTTIARWLYPNEATISRIQAAVAEDPETLQNREARMQSGLHGVAFQEWLHAWP